MDRRAVSVTPDGCVTAPQRVLVVLAPGPEGPWAVPVEPAAELAPEKPTDSAEVTNRPDTWYARTATTNRPPPRGPSRGLGRGGPDRFAPEDACGRARGVTVRTRRRVGLAALTAALATLPAACGESASTDPSALPARLVALSPEVDTVFTGERADPPVAVRVESALGDPVEGIPVRFLLLTEGTGTINAMAVSSREGIAESDFRAAGDPGEARIRADVPSAGKVRALEFRVVVVPATTVALSALGGDGQEAEVGSQLPLPFTVRAETPGGSPAGGVAVAWTVSGNPASARLTADTSFTDEEGRARTLLTLGSEAREYTVTAHAAAEVASDTVRFTARGAVSASGTLRLDSVRPLPLVAGEEATAFGVGFPATPGPVEVRVEGESAEVLETAADRVRFTVPAFGDRCLPARPVGVRVLASGEASNGEMADLLPHDPAVELAVGEALTLVAPDLGCLQLPAGDGPREYWLAVQSASRRPGGRAPVRLLLRSGEDLGFRRPAAFVSGRGIDPDVRAVAEASWRPELELRANARRELERRRIAPSAAPRLRRRAGTEPARPIEVPAVGDTLRFTFPVADDLTTSCADTSTVIHGVVRATGSHVALVEDVEAPADGFGPTDWTELRNAIDGIVFPTDTAYFGTPADIDGNGRVLIVLTPAVNRLTPRGSETGIGGFFLPLDLAASTSDGPGVPGPNGEPCPASNEGEIIYLAVADPQGRHGDPIEVARARRNALGLTAHELQHLINAERRVFSGQGGFERREELWLDEGLAHLAEEVAGLRAAELAVRQNLGFAPFAATRTALDLFNTFHIANFFQLSLYMLDPAGARTLSETLPSGFEGLQMRGFAWGFLRWLGDQEGAGDERLLFRRLVDGGPNGERGVRNIERATGKAWEELLADFTATLPLDDAGVENASPRHRIATWNLRDIYEALSQNASSRRRFPLPFPLAFERLGFASAAIDFELNASAAKYFLLHGAREAPPLAVRLGSRGGGPLPEVSVPQITIVRTR